MTQPTDIVLAGAGYMVLPGSYQRMSDGEPEGRAGRWVQRDFVGGQRRALQLERDRGWDSEGVGPALGGQGVEPWPHTEGYTDGGIAGRTVTAAQRVVSAIAGSRAYYFNGRYWYGSPPLTNPTWSGFNQYLDGGAGALCSDAAPYQDKIAICWGGTRDIDVFNPGTNTAAPLAAGEKGTVCVGYAGRLFFADETNAHELRLTTGGAIDTRLLDSPIVRMGLHGGKAVIATRTSIYLLGGKGDPATGTWIGEPEPLFSHGMWTGDQDYAFLLSYDGKLYTWLAGQVMEWNPNGGASKQGWRASGVEGRACFGAAVAGDRLVVAIAARNGLSQVWAFDGTGWWLIAESSSQQRCWPIALGGAGARDLVLFRDGSSSVTYDLLRLVYRDAALHNYASAGSYRTSLIDAGERDRMKAWRAIGASFATPEDRGNTASTDQVTVTVSYSVDAGQSFATHLSATQNDPTDRQLELEGEIAGGSPEGKSIQVRVEWSSVSDWAPVLTGIWVEYELLGTPARRRKWRMAVAARDGAVERDGAVHARTGREIAADLWSAWAINATLTLRDVDYDVTGEQYGVRIAGISEEIPKPSDGARWGESVLKLTLVEV